MQKQEILTALSLLSLLMIMVHLKNEPPLPHQEFNELELEFSEFKIEKDGSFIFINTNLLDDYDDFL